MDKKKGKKKLSICICCGVLEKEIRRIFADEELDIELLVLSSDFHMKPAKLSGVMGDVLRSIDTKPVLAVYGDCHPEIKKMQTDGDILKLKGVNCVELLLGSELYHKYRKGGTFFFLPEWTLRWKDLFIDQLGFDDQKTAGDFFNDMHSRFIYIDTGIIPVPQKTLDEISHYLSISIEVIHINLDQLKKNILSTLEEAGE